jgi:hypothetical protein
VENVEHSRAQIAHSGARLVSFVTIPAAGTDVGALDLEAGKVHSAPDNEKVPRRVCRSAMAAG